MNNQNRKRKLSSVGAHPEAVKRRKTIAIVDVPKVLGSFLVIYEGLKSFDHI